MGIARIGDCFVIPRAFGTPRNDNPEGTSVNAYNNLARTEDGEELDLSIVIVNWNTREFLDWCLASIYESLSGLSFEVIVADNNSSDGSAKMIRKKYPRVRLIENKRNYGFARASNQAIGESRGRYVLILNSDTILFSGTIEKLIEFMDGHKDAGAVSPRILNVDGSIQSQGRDLPNLGITFLQYFLPHKIYRIIEGLLRRQKGEILEVDGLSGSAILIRKKTLLSVGSFDENLPLYAEDIDLCYRIKKAGWKMYCCANVSISHLGGASTSLVPVKSKVKADLAPYAYFEKHYGKGIASLVRMMIALSSMMRMMAWLILYCLTERRQKGAAMNRIRSYTLLLLWAIGDEDAGAKRKWLEERR